MLGCRIGLSAANVRACLISCIFLLVGGFFFLEQYTWNRKMGPPRFHFTLIQENLQQCENISVNVSMSQSYDLRKQGFLEAVKRATGGGGVEGFSAQVPGQYQFMHYLAGQEAAKTVCETGFNLGHSSFSYLTANDRAIVHSFDLGKHGYAHTMSKYLTEQFPNRFFIHFGDSTKTVPEFIRSNPGFQCDFIFVDGGHVYPVAFADLKNFAKIANLEENIIIFDDYPTDWGANFGKAWEDVIKENVVEETTRCAFKNVIGRQRGFTLGRVVNRPREIITSQNP